jgi:hypothetical protein
MSTVLNQSTASGRRIWSAVASMSMCVAMLIASEFKLPLSGKLVVETDSLGFPTGNRRLQPSTTPGTLPAPRSHC